MIPSDWTVEHFLDWLTHVDINDWLMGIVGAATPRQVILDCIMNQAEQAMETSE